MFRTDLSYNVIVLSESNIVAVNISETGLFMYIFYDLDLGEFKVIRGQRSKVTVPFAA